MREDMGASVSQTGLSSPTEPSFTVSALTGFDPSRDSDTYALEAWAFNVMLECSGLDDEQPSEVAIGGAVLDLRDLDRILTWARAVATEGDPDALTGCADDLGTMTVPEADVAEIIAAIAMEAATAGETGR